MIRFTSRDPPIDGRVALVKLKRPWFFELLYGSGSVQLCGSHCDPATKTTHSKIECTSNIIILT